MEQKKRRSVKYSIILLQINAALVTRGRVAIKARGVGAGDQHLFKTTSRNRCGRLPGQKRSNAEIEFQSSPGINGTKPRSFGDQPPRRDVTPSLSSSRSIISSPNSTTKNFHGITDRPTVSEDLQGAAERRDDQDKPSSQLCSRCGRIIYGIGWPRDATERNADGAHREANTCVTAATPVKWRSRAEREREKENEHGGERTLWSLVCRWERERESEAGREGEGERNIKIPTLAGSSDGGKARPFEERDTRDKHSLCVLSGLSNGR